MNMKTKIYLYGLFALIAFLAVGCAQDLSPNSYSTGQVGVANRVVPATIISMRQVRIDNNSGVGGLAGAAGGAAAGSAIGGSPQANIVGAIGGAVVGGLIGNEIDKSVHKNRGMEYILKVTKTGAMISITQVDQLALSVGQHVLIVYGEQTRVIPDTSYQARSHHHRKEVRR